MGEAMIIIEVEKHHCEQAHMEKILMYYGRNRS